MADHTVCELPSNVTLAVLLSELKMKVVKVDRDGHCLLNAVILILQQSNKVSISNIKLCEALKRELGPDFQKNLRTNLGNTLG